VIALLVPIVALGLLPTLITGLFTPIGYVP